MQVLFKFKNVFLPMIRPSLHPCLRGILIHMCLLLTLLRIQHAYALEYDKPWLIEHYIQIFNMLVFSHWLQYAPPLHFHEILETYKVFLRITNMQFLTRIYYFFYFFLIHLVSSLLNSKNTRLVFPP